MFADSLPEGTAFELSVPRHLINFSKIVCVRFHKLVMVTDWLRILTGPSRRKG